MTDNPKISYIVPAYQAEKYVGRCLDSILGQSRRNLELIVVDDGSTDATARICAEYAARDDRLRLYRQARNSGVSAARNRGLDVATGEIICFVDSDDWIEPTHAAFVAENLRDGADILYFGFDFRVKKPIRKRYSAREAAKDFLNLKTLGGYGCNKAYRATLLDGVRFPLDMRIGEDGVFAFDAILRAGEVLYTNQPLYHYTIRADSASERAEFTRKQFDAFRQCEKIREALKGNPELSQYAPCFEATLYYSLLTRMLSARVTERYPDEYGRLLGALKTCVPAAFVRTSNRNLKVKCVLLFLYQKFPLAMGRSLVWLEHKRKSRR